MWLTATLPAVEPFGLRVARWLLIAAISTVALIGMQRAAQRVLPLAALLSLTLVFPDQAPSRFGIALRSGSTRQLQRRLDRIDEHGLGDTPREAAAELLVLVGALSRHDRLTRGHSERVRAYSQMIGEEMKLAPGDLDHLRWAGLLHDVGKLWVPAEILNKPGQLTAEEFDIVKQHPVHGERLVAGLHAWLGDSARAVVEHHERFAGGGYPYGLVGSEIALSSRIVSVADAFDVMTSARSYKSAASPEFARAEIERCAGTQFDPAVVRALLSISLGPLWRVMGPLSLLAQFRFFPRTLASGAPVVAARVAAVIGLVMASVTSVLVDQVAWRGGDAEASSQPAGRSWPATDADGRQTGGAGEQISAAGVGQASTTVLEAGSGEVVVGAAGVEFADAAPLVTDPAPATSLGSPETATDQPSGTPTSPDADAPPSGSTPPPPGGTRPPGRTPSPVPPPAATPPPVVTPPPAATPPPVVTPPPAATPPPVVTPPPAATPPPVVTPPSPTVPPSSTPPTSPEGGLGKGHEKGRGKGHDKGHGNGHYEAQG
jgi:hypothetical protein